MADKDEQDKKTDKEIDKNPDLLKETEGMVDLSDVLAGGDNDSGSADGAEAIASNEDGLEEVDLFEKSEIEEPGLEVVESPGFFRKLIAKFFPDDSKQRELLDSFSGKLGKLSSLLKSLALKSRDRGIKFIKSDSKVILAVVLGKIKLVVGVVSNTLKSFFSLSWKLKILFVCVVGLGFLTVNVAIKSLDGQLIPELPDVYHSNFNEVANEIYKIEPSARWEAFRNAIRFPEYIVKLERLIVMLKPSQFSGSAPMGVFALYLETSSSSAATELKVRESEVRDLSARTLEDISYDQIRSAEGKRSAKKSLIRSLNKILNQGKLVNVYFKDFVLKP